MVDDMTVLDKELYVISCGYYDLVGSDVVCKRPKGRNDYHLIYVINGQSRVWIGETEHILNSGDIVFYNINDGQKYSHLSDYNTSVYWIHFCGSTAAELLNELGFSKSMIIRADADISDLFDSIIKELTYKRKAYVKQSRAYLTMLITVVSRCMESEEKSPYASKFNYIISIMGDSEKYDMTVDDYAAICGLSKSRFIKNFTEYTGKTPISYKTGLIVKNAEWFLVNTLHTITEISEMLGFENASYFSMVFKKYTGVSPMRFRKNAMLQ